MVTKKISVTTAILLSVLTVVLCQISGKTSEVRAAEEQDKPMKVRPSGRYGDDAESAEWCDWCVAAYRGGTYRRSGFVVRGPCASGGSCTASRPQARR